MNKEDENKIIEIIEALPVYRDVFIRKSALIRELENTFPEKKEVKKND